MSHINMSPYWKSTLKSASPLESRLRLDLGNVENIKLSEWEGSSQIHSVGTVKVGEWRASIVSPEYGGTGKDFSSESGILSFKTGYATLKNCPHGYLVGDKDAQTLTNKTIDASQNTITHLDGNNINDESINVSKINLKDNFDLRSGMLLAANPSYDDCVATKSYVDNAIQGIVWKKAVKVACDNNIELNEEHRVFQGVELQPEDRVLLFGQYDESENGVYQYSDENQLIRACDFTESQDFIRSALYVNHGKYHHQSLICITQDISLGNSPIVFSVFNKLLDIHVDDGLIKDGNIISAHVDDKTITIKQQQLSLKPSSIEDKYIKSSSISYQSIQNTSKGYVLLGRNEDEPGDIQEIDCNPIFINFINAKNREEQCKQLQLDKVDNSADIDKPISTKTYEALNKKVNVSHVVTINFNQSPYLAEVDQVILVDATINSTVVDLPSANSNKGNMIIIKKTDKTTNTVTIDGYCNEMIDAKLTITLDEMNESVRLISDDSNWYMI